MSTKCYVNCEVGLDGDGYACIFSIESITQEPLYKVYSIPNLPAHGTDQPNAQKYYSPDYEASSQYGCYE